MKKLDKLLLSSFFGPFIITFFVVVFILLTVFMLKYFDELVGKDLGFAVISRLIFYFSINMTTNALPLAVLLSSLMTFGNLGVHSELTAIKSSGISFLRTMRPLFLVTCIIVVIGFYNNNYIVPKANLEAFSLLYDIKQKKPALDIREGVFYSNIPGYSIKINERMDDDETLKDIIIYRHFNTRGNKEITLADSGKMYNILNNRYLVFELFDGKDIREQNPQRRRGYKRDKSANPYLRSSFSQRKIVLNLSEFDLKRTKKELFNNNRLMKTIDQLRADLDSMNTDYIDTKYQIYLNVQNMFKYHAPEVLEKRGRIVDSLKSIHRRDTTLKIEEERRPDTVSEEFIVKDLEQGDSAELKLNPRSQYVLENADSAQLEKAVRIQNKVLKRNIQLEKTTKRKGIGVPDDTVITQGEKIKDKVIVAEADKDKKKIKPAPANSDSIRSANLHQSMVVESDSVKSREEVLDSLINTDKVSTMAVSKALNHVRYVKGSLVTNNSQIDDKIKLIRKFEIERYKKLAMALTILAMFLIGAPLGAIVKKGGLGMPVLFSVVFFVLFYIISMLGEKWARQGIMDPLIGVWLANFVLFPIGIIFLIQARRDAKLFDSDYYIIMWNRMRKFFQAIKSSK